MEEHDRPVPSVFVIPMMQMFLGVLLFIALLYGLRDLIVLALIVLGMLGGAKLWSRMSLSGIKSESTVDKEKVFPGEKLTLGLSAENKKFLPIWLQIKVPVSRSLHHSSAETTLTRESSLLWYQNASFQWEFIATRRGVHQIGPPHLLAGDLFAFFF